MSDGWTVTGLLLSGGAAGIVNAVAGGGPIITLAGLTALGIDPRIASMTSTVALSPGQVLAGWSGLQTASRRSAAHELSLAMLATAAVGGGLGALLLLFTMPDTFRRLAPWLVLFATGVYAHVSRPGRGQSASQTCACPRGGFLPAPVSPPATLAVYLTLALLGVYGGYFGGGNSFLVLSLIVASKLDRSHPVGTKNAVIAAMNCGACVVLVASSHVLWAMAAPLCAGGVAGSWLGSKLAQHVAAGALRWLVILVGMLLCAWLFIQR